MVLRNGTKPKEADSADDRRRALLLPMEEKAMRTFLTSLRAPEVRKFASAFFCRGDLKGSDRSKGDLIDVVVQGVRLWRRGADDKERKRRKQAKAKELDSSGREVAADRGYKYFGAAKDLPGVMEPFEQSKELEQMRQSRAELMRAEEEEVEIARSSCFVEEEELLPVVVELELKETTKQINEIRDLHAADLTEDVKQKLYLTGIRPPLPKKKEKDEFPELPTEALILCQRAWGCGPSDEVFCQGFDAKITRKDLATLKPCKWLNDEVIMFFLNLICNRSKIDKSLPKVYTFNTFFFVNISTKGYNSVRRWTRNVDIFSFDILLVPVHVSGVHWCMAVVDFGKKSIEYFDPMHHSDNGALSFIQQYLKDESKGKIPESPPAPFSPPPFEPATHTIKSAPVGGENGDISVGGKNHRGW